MLRYLLCLIALVGLGAEVVDRLAITVDHQVITELQIDEELRVTAFLNRRELSRDREARRAAADRIVAQLLVGREMELSHFPNPETAVVERYLGEIRASFENDAKYREALSAYRISQEVLEQHLATQLAALGFIEIRFRPKLDIPDSEIETYYTRQMQTWSTDHPGQPAPTLSQERARILQLLTEEHTNQILDIWLEEARKQVSINYLDTALQ